jgi:hypothetical protein
MGCGKKSKGQKVPKASMPMAMPMPMPKKSKSKGKK